MLRGVDEPPEDPVNFREFWLATKRTKGDGPLYQSLLANSSFFDLLLRLDEELARQTRQAGCRCGGVLHCAHYRRKPRGGPRGLGPEHEMRFSFCCAVDGCRRRTTPPSLRFLGRKVYYGVVVLLLPILLQGPTPRRLLRLQVLLSVSVRTLRRWRRWWRESVAASRFMLAVRGHFATPVASEALPGSLLAAFAGLAEPAARVVAVLRFLGPLSTGSSASGSRFSRFVPDPQKMHLDALMSDP